MTMKTQPLKNTLMGFALLAFAATSCTGSQDETTTANAQNTESKIAIVHDGEQPTQEQQALMDYLAVKDALVKTDAEGAQRAAEKLMASLKQLKGPSAKQATSDAEAIAATGEVEKQREHFEMLSENMYAMMKADKPIEGTLYKQYCPMAFQNEGAFWLSTEKDILNPYFGNKMLKCGVVKEEI